MLVRLLSCLHGFMGRSFSESCFSEVKGYFFREAWCGLRILASALSSPPPNQCHCRKTMPADGALNTNLCSHFLLILEGACAHHQAEQKKGNAFKAPPHQQCFSTVAAEWALRLPTPHHTPLCQYCLQEVLCRFGYRLSKPTVVKRKKKKPKRVADNSLRLSSHTHPIAKCFRQFPFSTHPPQVTKKPKHPPQHGNLQILARTL